MIKNFAKIAMKWIIRHILCQLKRSMMNQRQIVENMNILKILEMKIPINCLIKRGKNSSLIYNLQMNTMISFFLNRIQLKENYIDMKPSKEFKTNTNHSTTIGNIPNIYKMPFKKPIAFKMKPQNELSIQSSKYN